MEGYRVDCSRFDRFAKVVAQSRFTRRGSLRAGGLGLTAALAAGFDPRDSGFAGVVSAAQATPESCPGAKTVPAEGLTLDGAWLCDQTFALCTTALCELAPDDSSIANCRCVVIDSLSIGFKTCTERAQSGNSLTSNFSTANVNSAFSIMTCPDGDPWANCLDMPCEINTTNPAEAICQCQMVETGVNLTFGGGCDTSTCSTVIWSAATTELPGSTQYAELMKQIDQPVTLPPVCPGGTAPATPVG